MGILKKTFIRFLIALVVICLTTTIVFSVYKYLRLREAETFFYNHQKDLNQVKNIFLEFKNIESISNEPKGYTVVFFKHSNSPMLKISYDSLNSILLKFEQINHGVDHLFLNSFIEGLQRYENDFSIKVKDISWKYFYHNETYNRSLQPQHGDEEIIIYDDHWSLDRKWGRDGKFKYF